MKKETGFFRKMWVIFKNGKAEIWFLLNLYNTFQLWLIRGQDIRFLVLIIAGLVALSLAWGYVDIKKIKTSSPYLNPFQQDTIRSSVLLYDGFIELAQGLGDQSAFNLFLEARELRVKWLDQK